jgi:tetratricopeptide (TPR) repeat protein
MTTDSLEARVRHCWGEAQAHIQARRFLAAHAALEACLDLLQEPGHLHTQYTVWLEIGGLHELQGDHAQARSAFDTARTVAERLGDRGRQAQAGHRLGHVERLAGDSAAAQRSFEAALLHARVAGDVRGAALTLAMLGQMACTAGQMEDGLRQMLQALQQLPEDAAEHGHLLEHTAYFALRVAEDVFARLVEECIADAELRERLSRSRASR